MRSITVRITDLPVFRDEPPTLAAAVSAGASSLLALLLADLVLLMAAVLAVLRYDVR